MSLGNKQYFSVTLEWKKDHEMILHTREIPDTIVGPPVTHEGKPHYTTGQDLFLGSIATCLASTFITNAKDNNLEYTMFKVHVEGILQVFDPSNVKFTEVSTVMNLAINKKEDIGLAKEVYKQVTNTTVIGLTIEDCVKLKHSLQLFVQE